MKQKIQDSSNSSRFADKILKADMYAQYVHLSVQGKKKIYTLAGLVSTILVFASILGFGMYKGVVLLQRTEFETQMASVLRPINYSNPDIIQMNEYGFDFAVRTFFPLPEIYGKLQIEHTTSIKKYNEELGIKEKTTNTEVLDLELCSNETFNHTDKEEIETKRLSLFYCISDKSFIRFGGSYEADHYEYLSILLKPCENNTEVICASPEEIQDHFKTQSIQFRIINYYFDKDQKHEPVQSYIHDSIYFGILPEQQLFRDLQVKLSKAVYDDSLKPWSSRTEIEFPQIDNVHESAAVRSHPDPYMKVAIKLDFFSNMYSKSLFSITDYFSELGGLFNALYGFGRLIIFLFMDSYILSILMKSLFAYTEKSDDSSFNQLQEKAFSFKSDIISDIASRKPLISNSSSYGYLSCRSCCASNQSEKRAQQLFKQGKKRIRTELDIVALFRMMQEFTLIKRLLFNSRQLSLLKWQKAFTLDSDLEKLQENQNLSSFASYAPFEKLSELGRLQDIVETTQKLQQKTKVDDMLLQGLTQFKVEPPDDDGNSNKSKNGLSRFSKVSQFDRYSSSQKKKDKKKVSVGIKMKKKDTSPQQKRLMKKGREGDEQSESSMSYESPSRKILGIDIRKKMAAENN